MEPEDRNFRIKTKGKKTKFSKHLPPLVECSTGKGCVICQNYMVNVIMIPCGHMYSCSQCAVRNEKVILCAICRKKVTKVQSVYDSTSD